MSNSSSFAELAASPAPPLDVLALALAGQFREVDAPWAMARLDALGGELSLVARKTDGTAEAVSAASAQLLGGAHGFAGDQERYDHPNNSMLDLVLARRRGLPILLSVVYVEVARRAEIPLAGVGLSGHFVVGHFGTDPPLLIDPFAGGALVQADLAQGPVRPWGSREIAMRMLNNLVAAYQRRGDLGSAIRAASMRLELPADGAFREQLETELRSLQVRLN